MKGKKANAVELEELKRFFETAGATYMAHLSIDSVIFSFHQKKLKVLLVRVGETPHFALPGGFIKFSESIDDAALRILQERTGLEQVYLEQFCTSGSVMRSRDKTVIEMITGMVGGLPPDHWFHQRFVSICYYSLIQHTKVKVKPGVFDMDCQWVNIEEVPALLFDHNKIVETALTRLREDLDRKLVGFRLLHDPFTMNELQELYEAVHQKAFVRTNFQRRMLGMNILKRIDKKYTGQSNKAPYTYTFSEG